MGQEQSAPTPRRTPNRLSKPRTNTTGNIISKIPGPPSRRGSQSNNGSPVKTTRHSFLSTDAVVGETEKPKTEKQRKRISLFRSKSSQAKENKSQLDLGIEADFVVPSPVDKPLPVRRHSRTNSVTTLEEHTQEFYSNRPPNYSRMSLQHFPYQQHHTRLSNVAEVRSPEPPEDDSETEPRSRYEEPEVLRPLPRTNSDTTLYGPIRRRSLLQHGVATRKMPFPKNDSRQSLPSQVYASDLQSYYYNPAKSTTSPLSNIAGLGLEVDDGYPIARVETPTDMGYGHTGIFKLGSLRITNGAASPAPSEGRPSTSGEGEDYLTVGAKKSLESYHPQRPSQKSNALAAPIDIARPWTARAESPLRQAHEVEPEVLKIETTLPLPDPSFALFNFGAKDSPTKSLDLANEYKQDLALSPFSFEASPPASPKLQATSKHMAVEDDLFEAEPISARPLPEHAPDSFDSGYGTAESTKPFSLSQQLSPKPLAKADSGYSSNISLRSFKKDSARSEAEKEPPPTPPKDVISRAPSSTYSQETPSRVPSSTYSVSSQASEATLRVQRSLPALPREEPVPPPPSRDAPPVPPKHATTLTEIPVRSPNRSTETKNKQRSPKHIRQHSVPSILKPVQQSPVLREKSSNSGDSVSSNGSRWRSSKGQKQRPKSVQPAPVYTIQAVRASGVYGIPAVPIETSKKLDERVDAFPIASIPNTFAGFAGLRRTGSKETLTTIFSVGSAEVRAEINFARLQGALPPVPTHAAIPEYAATTLEQNPSFERRASYQPQSYRSIPPRKPFESRRSLPAIPRDKSPPQPRKSTEQQREEFEAHVTDFDTISSSLGSSPYDVAISATGRPQSSGANARAKSMTSQLEADAAAQFHQARSVCGASSMLGSRKSYDSIAAGNPFSSGTNTASHSRKGSREYPPQAHSNTSGKRPYSFVPPPSQPLPPLPNEIKKTKTPPPISMKTQRKSLPAMRSSPMSAPQPVQSIPVYKPHSWVNPVQDQVKAQNNAWAEPSNYWAERRKSAGEQLSRSRPGSARPSMEYERPTLQLQSLKTHASFDQSMRSQWEADHADHHAQGSYSFTYSQPASQPQHTEDEYYGQEDEENALDHELFSSTKRGSLGGPARNGSTDDMLVLDRYTGGLGYGLEGRGLVASAGTRNNGTLLGGDGVSRKGEKVARDWGVDLSDVPVFLQRVRVES